MCKHGREALSLATSCATQGVGKAIHDQSNVHQEAKDATWLESSIPRGPETATPLFQFPDGIGKKSRENRGRRRWSTRVPELLRDLGEASRTQLDRRRFFRRRRLQRLVGRHSIGKGTIGASPFKRLYAVVARACSHSIVQHAGDMATNTTVRAIIKTPPGEASLQNYFHDLIVLWGLKIWLAMTARTVHKIARYAIVDSTAFADTFVEVWRESEHGLKRIRTTSRWLKAHVLSDAATNMIGALIATTNTGGSRSTERLKG